MIHLVRSKSNNYSEITVSVFEQGTKEIKTLIPRAFSFFQNGGREQPF